VSNVVNLNRFRKQKARANDKKRAEGNRAKFGRTKDEKQRAKSEAEKHERHLDGHDLKDQ